MALLSVAKVFAKKAATSTVKSTATKAGGAIVKAKPIKAKGGALAVVKKGGIKKKKVDKQVFMNDEKARKRRLELKAREDDEKLLEAGDDPSKNKKRMKKPKIIGSLIDYLKLVIIGWFVDKLPKIIAWIENLIAKIKKIVDAIKKFFGGIADVIKNIGKAIGDTWNKIKSIKIPDIGDAIKSGFDNIKNAFSNIIDRLKDGAANFLGLSKKDTKGKKIDENTKPEDLQDPEFKSVMKDMEKTMGDMNSTWDGALQQMEESSTGSQIADDVLKSSDKSAGKTGDKQTKVTPTEKKVSGSTIKGDSKITDLSGKTGMPGLGGYIPGDGKGGSTYSDDEKIDIKPIDSSNIKSNKRIVPTNSITPERKGEEIIVIDEGPSTSNVSAPNGGGSTKIIVVEASVNSVLEKQLLTNLS
jgi:hypothetical protein